MDPLDNSKKVILKKEDVVSIQTPIQEHLSNTQEKSKQVEESSIILKEKEPAVIQREVIYAWASPMRHFKKMDMKKYYMILAIVLGFFVILVLVAQWWLMVAIASVMFLIYAWGTVPPANLTHEITTLGLESAGTEVRWDNLTAYYFTKKDEQYILNVETNLRLPGRFIMLVSDDNMQKTHEILSMRLKYKDMRKQNKVEKTVDGEWVNLLSAEQLAEEV